MYGKLYEQTFTGSMVGSGPIAFAVLAYIVAHTKPDHRVELNARILAMLIGCEEEQVAAVIKSFCEPDPASRSKDHAGRKLIKEGEYLYFVTGHDRFRNCKDNEGRKEYQRNYQKERRKRLREQKRKQLPDAQHEGELAVNSA
jgi:hypothetical protein